MHLVKILIVDDQPQFRRALRLALGVKGYEIREAANGVDALSLMQDEAPDLVLVDWLMPGMDGSGLCRAIRTRSDVPIIVITSKQGARSDALAAGANGYLTKPFAVDELLVHIESALAN
jgi:two-component system KDP operon response regulator KdpE